MKFERGRKKNQLIWTFILKDIASQSSVFNKIRKRKRFGGKYVFEAEETYFRGLRVHLNTWWRGWVTDSGSSGPTGQV